MIWMSWRQFRAQALVAAAGLVVIAAGLVVLGMDIRDTYDTYLARCQGDCADAMSQFTNEYRNLLLFLDAGFILVPGLLGMFWGAPLVARELETGTHRLVWNQSVPRRRWLAVKLLFAGLAGMTATGLVSLLLTWAAGPVDQVANDRFETLVFSARHVAPVAYAAFAVVLGTVIGLLIRRTLPAMALTLLVFIAVQIAMPNLVRPYLMPPITTSKPMTSEAINELRSLGGLSDRPTIGGLTIPDAWVTDTSELLTADGQPLDADKFNKCIGPDASDDSPREGGGRFGAAAQCLGDLDLHVTASYQPNHRYWLFQWLESAIYLTLSTLLAVLGRWRIQHRL
ncbi:transmembrane transport protein [Kibdelosporangium aridum]|uniref:Transmembrane transport protein n=2 Tax=Kibdelosporangium aridum TaxID=2030 RepID=A0A428Z451_KIBAR|nr:transmembrane transport protein [Kibdelosporangium aridum]